MKQVPSPRRTSMRSVCVWGGDNGLRRSSYSSPLFPVQGGCKLPSPLVMEWELLCFVAEHPFDVPHLTRTIGRNAVHPSEGSYLVKRCVSGSASTEGLVESAFR